MKSLTAAAAKLSNEDYEIEIEHSDTYEIQQLSSAFENMLVKLREHKRHQLLLTYRDSMTGLRNTTAFKDWVLEFNKKIKYEGISFGIVVFDLNYLKRTNDTYGHIVGNNLIVTASQIIADTFKKSPVFRIGGDEFVAILQNHDLEDRDMLFSQFEATCENTTLDADGKLVPVSIAKGFAMFDPSTDTQFSDVFNRADEKMYQHKKQSKIVLS